MDEFTAAADQGHTLNAIRSETGVLIQTSSTGAIHLSAEEAGKLGDALVAMAEQSWGAFAAQADASANEQAASDEIRQAEAAVQAATAMLARAKQADAQRAAVGAPQPASVAAKGAEILPPSANAASTEKSRPWAQGAAESDGQG